jgi:hypothetical protein
MSQKSLTAEQILSATEQIVCKPWKKERFEVYLQFDKTPARVTFNGHVARKLFEGNTQPLEWRLSDELPYDPVVDDGSKKIIERWFSELDPDELVGGEE